MNNNLKNYKADPDPEVWNGIEKTLRRRTLRRYGWTAAIGAVIAVAAIVAVSLWPSQTQQAPVAADMPEVAQVVAPVQEAVVAEAQTPAAVKEIKTADPAKSAVTPVAAEVQTVETRPAETAAPVVTEPVVRQSAPAQAAVSTSAKPAQVETPAVARPVQQSQQVAEEAPAPAKSTPKSSFNTNIEDTIIWLPNIFAPASGDEAISVFRARLNQPGESISNFKMTIFNRAGHQVFVSNDINYGWDGTYKGREMPQATYVYIVYYTDSQRLQHQRKGTITLVR